MTTYMPKHEQRRSNAYYITRSIVRGIFWSLTVIGAAGLILLGITALALSL